MEQAVESDLFTPEHLRLFWDCALQELLVNAYKKKGKQEKVSLMLQIISRTELGQNNEGEHREHFVNQLYSRFLRLLSAAELGA